MRVAFLERVSAAFVSLTRDMAPMGELSVRWQWTGREKPLHDVLQAQLSGDIERGYTFLSAARGDVVFLRESRVWSGSRGENKVAGMLLQLAVQQVLQSATSEPQVVLLDDPLAEVSARYIAPILRAWIQSAEQVIVTSLEPLRNPDAAFVDVAMFHVEQGRVSPR